MSIQTHWKLRVKIWIDHFQVEIMKKTDQELQTFHQLCSITRAYLGKLCVHFLELPFLKYNENAVFLFRNTYNKEKGPFLLESDMFYYFWWLLLFSKYGPG